MITLTTTTLPDPPGLVVDQFRVAGGGPTALVLPGFGRTADEFFFFTALLLHNGLSVVVADFRHHPGRSSGDILGFTVSEQARDIVALLGAFGPDVVLATSLSFRSALRALAETPSASTLVGIVPVVSLINTCTVVTGIDWHEAQHDLDHQPRVLDVDGFAVGIALVEDALEHDLATSESSCVDVARVAGPVHLVAGSSDPWVDAVDLRSLADAAGCDVTTLDGAGHDFSRSLRRARTLFTTAAGRAIAGRSAEVRSPLLNDVIEARAELLLEGSTTRLDVGA